MKTCSLTIQNLDLFLSTRSTPCEKDPSTDRSSTGHLFWVLSYWSQLTQPSSTTRCRTFIHKDSFQSNQCDTIRWIFNWKVGLIDGTVWNKLRKLIMYGKVSSLFMAGCASSSFVLSLYFWPNQRHRDDVEVIKKRFISVSFSMLFSIYLLHLNNINDFKQLHSLLGFQAFDILSSFALPIFLTSILFLGPILSHIQSGNLQFAMQLLLRIENILSPSMLVLRNYFVAPFSEELIFRGVVVAFLKPYWSPFVTCIWSGLLFGAAHSHHYLASKWNFPGSHGINITPALALLQMTYTSIFGTYAASLYLKTQCIATPVLLHTICNLIGLPDFATILESKFLMVMTVLGFVCWLPLYYYFLASL